MFLLLLLVANISNEKTGTRRQSTTLELGSRASARKTGAAIWRRGYVHGTDFRSRFLERVSGAQDLFCVDAATCNVSLAKFWCGPGPLGGEAMAWAQASRDDPSRRVMTAQVNDIE